MKALGKPAGRGRPRGRRGGQPRQGQHRGRGRRAAGGARRGGAGGRSPRASSTSRCRRAGRALGHAAPAHAGAPRDRGRSSPGSASRSHRALDRDRLPQLRRAQHAAGPPRARHAGHLLRRGRAHPALAHLAGADPHHAGGAAAGADHRARQRLPPRRRRHPLADVPAGRGAAGRPRTSRSPISRGRCCTSCSASSAPALGMRLRPSYFPFTEPSAEVDVACYLCEGGSAQVGRARGLPPVQGHAAGSRSAARAWCTRTSSAPSATTRRRSRASRSAWASSRMAMLKYGIDDLRSFYENDVRFLAQFR